MITRFVKLSFNEDYCIEFETKFTTSIQKLVASQTGCSEVKLFKAAENIYFTVSKWHSEDDLNNYRKSDLFKKIWSEFKVNFSSKAAAWSTNEVT